VHKCGGLLVTGSCGAGHGALLRAVTLWLLWLAEERGMGWGRNEQGRNGQGRKTLAGIEQVEGRLAYDWTA
jgi:hypothetical protein